ncbi:hypothetical protein KMW28_10600 [Flammeovirga yaeyamensis]|uniref:Uncharacterized protein n=1 Tax=Flammeovirga yaeyamensis TaxID=367791 RepID=A0AAX1MXP8_9BACT|nr:hypothetical protein [Flammeovirga yaeyamensis]MBB3696395.1 transcriptional regulator [Flammeovirga yaeyamensis]NMF35074.1 hypothetical protein [Flammeovirga yaeyamensis]QWG00105.1 hypothetical protein KMW28_10600 [Flammeovirga yaeyamensis]
MKKSILKIFATTLLMLTVLSFDIQAKDDNRIVKTHNIDVAQIVMTIQYGDGFFTLTRRLFKVLEKDPRNVTWDDVLLLKTIYEEQKGSDKLEVGEKFIIIKNEFI